jgi:hypothetical protein
LLFRVQDYEGLHEEALLVFQKGFTDILLG